MTARPVRIAVALLLCLMLLVLRPLILLLMLMLLLHMLLPMALVAAALVILRATAVWVARTGPLLPPFLKEKEMPAEAVVAPPADTEMGEWLKIVEKVFFLRCLGGVAVVGVERGRVINLRWCP